MSWRAELREAIRDTIKEMIGDPQMVSCTVKSVDRQAGTIVATDGDGLDYADVRLKAVADGNGTGLLILPVVGSQVVVSVLDGIDTMTFVSQYSDIESFTMTTAAGISLALTKDGELHLNGDSLAGLVKAVELETELNKTNAVVDAIQKVLTTTWTPKPSDGGASLKVAATLALTDKAVGNFSNLQNQKVKHGE